MSLLLNFILFAGMFASTPEKTTIYWKDYTPEEQENILNSSYIPENVREYYFRTERPGDDAATFRLLNMISDSSYRLPEKALYLYMFDKILAASDGALAEVIGQYCVKILLSDVEYVMYFLKEHPEKFSQYAGFIGDELYFNSFEPSGDFIRYDAFKSIVNEEAGDNPDFKDILSVFYAEIERMIAVMEQDD